MDKETYSIIQIQDKHLICKKNAEYTGTAEYAGKSMLFKPDVTVIEDPFDTMDEAISALDQLCIGQSKPEPEDNAIYKEYEVSFSVSGTARVIAASKKEAIEKVSELTFGNRVNRDTATVIGTYDLPAEELS